MQHKALATAAVVSITALALFTGCSQGGGAAAATGDKLSAEQVAALGDVSLTIASFSTGGQAEALERSAAAFEELYPNVDVEVSFKAFDDYGRTIDLTMQSNDAPDIAQANAVMARRLVPGKLILPLDDYWEAYGWDDRFPEAIKGTLTLSEDGKEFGAGAGPIWGAAPGGNIVGVFYNKAVLADLGLELPTNFDEFVASMEVAKKAGVQAVVLGNLEQWPSNHILSPLLGYSAAPKRCRVGSTGSEGASPIPASSKACRSSRTGWTTDTSPPTRTASRTMMPMHHLSAVAASTRSPAAGTPRRTAKASATMSASW